MCSEGWVSDEKCPHPILPATILVLNKSTKLSRILNKSTCEDVSQYDTLRIPFI